MLANRMNLAEEPLKTIEAVVPRMCVNLPSGVPADVTLAHDDSPVDRCLAGDLVVMYAFDVGTHYEIVANRDLRRLGVSKDELHDRAVGNLRALRLDVRAHQGARTMMLTAGGNYEATLLLLPEIWDSVAGMVDGELVVSVPARDVLYLTGDASPENLSELRGWTSKMLEQADKPLSRVFLRRNGAQWEPYTGFAD